MFHHPLEGEKAALLVHVGGMMYAWRKERSISIRFGFKEMHEDECCGILWHDD